jgi:hypothetical protein
MISLAIRRLATLCQLIATGLHELLADTDSDDDCTCTANLTL